MSTKTWDTIRNLATGHVAVPPSPALTGTTLTLEAGQGALFGEAPFAVEIVPKEAAPEYPNVEFAHCIERKGDTLTLERNVGTQSNSSARAVQIGDTVSNGPFAKALEDIQKAITIPTANSGTVYVSTAGNDSYTGASWAEAKATIDAAISALPLGADGETPNGVVEVGYGIWKGKSYGRVDKVTLQGTAVVLDPSITAEDLGAYVLSEGGHINEFAKIEAVVPGVAFTMNHTTTSIVAEEVLILRPYVNLPVGVELRGRGRMNGLKSGESANYPTGIEDSGTGVTIIGWSGTGPSYKPPENVSYTRQVIEDLTLIGNASNIAGYGVANTWGLHIRGVTAKNHGRWGMWIGENSSVCGGIQDVECRSNGTEAATVATGGLYCAPQPNEFSLYNIRCHENYGNGAQLTGVQCFGCTFSHTLKSKVAGATGYGVTYTQNAAGNGTGSLYGCWLEGNATAEIQGGLGALLVSGCFLQGDKIGEYGIQAGKGQVTIQGGRIQNHTKAAVAENSVESPIVWDNVSCEESTEVFIERHKKENNIPQSAASSRGSINVGKVTYPGATSEVELKSGTAWHNTTGADVRLAVSIAFKTTGVAKIQRGATSPGTTLGTLEPKAESTDVREWYVPMGYYLTVTLTEATFPTKAIAQPA